MRKKPKIIVIVGPNASGKSDFGVKIAKKVDGEIISADSRQVYRGLDIGSGKVPGVWRTAYGIRQFVYKGIPHHCIDIADPKKVFTADNFRKCAQNAILDILSRGKTPIIVGGTGFYIDAALGRMKLGGVPPNQKLRQKLEKKSAVELLKMLKKLDPDRAKTIEQKNPRRLIRAIEIALYGAGSNADSLFSLTPAGSLKVLRRSSRASREPARFAQQTRSLAFLPAPKKGKADEFQTDFAAFSAWSPPKAERKGLATSESRAGGTRMRSEIASAFPKIKWLGIKRSPEELKKRIHKRLLARLPGIIREVKKLHRDGVSWKRLYDLGLEYRYASLYLRGKLDKNQLTSQLENSIKRYAKRQMTWFKKNKEIKWIAPILLLLSLSIPL